MGPLESNLRPRFRRGLEHEIDSSRLSIAPMALQVVFGLRIAVGEVVTGAIIGSLEPNPGS